MKGYTMSKSIAGSRKGSVQPWKHRRTEIRRTEAENRQAQYDAKTPKQILGELDAMGLRASEERARLQFMDQLTPVGQQR